MLIRRTDQLGDILDRDPGMVEILTQAFPELGGLHDPVTRRVMGRLGSVERVARMVGVEPDILVRRVNHLLLSQSRKSRVAVPQSEAR